MLQDTRILFPIWLLVCCHDCFFENLIQVRLRPMLPFLWLTQRVGNLKRDLKMVDRHGNMPCFWEVLVQIKYCLGNFFSQELRNLWLLWTNWTLLIGRKSDLKKSKPTLIHSLQNRLLFRVITYAFFQAGFSKVRFVPVSGLSGDNLANRVPANHPLGTWYRGGPLVDFIGYFRMDFWLPVFRLVHRPTKSCWWSS